MHCNKLLALAIIVLASCTYDKGEPIVDCTVDGPLLELLESENTSCGLSAGMVSLSASGGSGSYTFTSILSGQQSAGLFTELPAGNHVFMVSDENGCTNSLEVIIENLEGVVINSISVQDAGCNISSGSITVFAENGTTPYSYKLDSGSFQEQNVFSQVSSGIHLITILDDVDCEFSQEVQVMSGVSFSNTISPIISNNCVVPGCHSGTQFPDFRNFDNIQDNAAQIKIRTGSLSMPQIGSLTQNEIDKIACWVEDGALNN